MKIKPYPTRCPVFGEHVYVPSSTQPQHVIGGLATITQMDNDPRIAQRHRRFAVLEAPGAVFVWGDLKYMQESLWRVFGTNAARLPTEAERAALAAEREAARSAAQARVAAAAEADRVRWLPHRFQVMNGGLLEMPIWGTHHRCRNWAAIISLAPALPGGIDRWWFNRGAGPVKLIVPNELEVHDPIEFGADYIRGSGYRDPERWYGVILENEPTHLLVDPCRDVMHALMLSAARQRGEVQAPQASEAAPHVT
jgi:hypothetical protein